MQNIVCQNEHEVKEGHGSKEVIKKGYNLWVDLVNSTESELSNLQQSFNFDKKAFKPMKTTPKNQVLQKERLNLENLVS